MASYAKLFSSILDSSIWCESLPVKVLWISMLARADRGGVVIASVPGLAKLAGISTKECRDGLERLSSPDPESGTKDFGGRRIMEVDRGWVILNYVKFRDMKSDEEIREKVRVRVHNFREKHKTDVTDVTLCNALYPSVTESNDIADADTDTKAVKEKDFCSEVKKRTSEQNYSPVVMTLPCVGTGDHEWPVTEAMLTKWSEAFPGIDCAQETRKMLLWLESNPKKKKTYSGMGRFALGWLGGAQNKGNFQTPSSHGGPNGPAQKRHHRSDSDDAFLAQLERQSQHTRAKSDQPALCLGAGSEGVAGDI